MTADGEVGKLEVSRRSTASSSCSLLGELVDDADDGSMYEVINKKKKIRKNDK
jgi:hypothetical protein